MSASGLEPSTEPTWSLELGLQMSILSWTRHSGIHLSNTSFNSYYYLTSWVSSYTPKKLPTAFRLASLPCCLSLGFHTWGVPASAHLPPSPRHHVWFPHICSCRFFVSSKRLEHTGCAINIWLRTRNPILQTRKTKPEQKMPLPKAAELFGGRSTRIQLLTNFHDLLPFYHSLLRTLRSKSVNNFRQLGAG